MKLLLALTVVVFAALMAGCGNPPSGAPDVEYEVIEQGAELRLTWSAVQDAEGYKIYVDGVEEADITGTSYDVAGPARTVGVTAYGNGEETNEWTLDVSPTVTADLTVYGRGDPDPDHPSGFGFLSDGSAVAYALSDSSTWPNLDFYLDDLDYPSMTLCSPDIRGYNTQENTSAEHATTDFDAVDLAATLDYLTSRAVAEEGVYSIWIDPTANGWDDTEDHFGKMKVLSVVGHVVHMKLAYQEVKGLRWVKTP